jgi:hypothetical protein
MAINTPPTALELQNAGTDLDTLDKVINGAADLGGTGSVETRRSGPVQTLAWFLAQLETQTDAAAAQVASLTGLEAAIAAIAAGLASGQPLDLIADNLNNLIAASGIYPAPLGAHDALEDEVITDPRVTVLHEDELYRPRVLPHTITLPFDPDDFYLMAAQGSDSAFVLAELRRLATYHPAVAPTWLPVDAVIVDETDAGAHLDLALKISDADSPPENLVFTAPEGLPAGWAIDGRLLRKTSTSGVIARAAHLFRVTDENGLWAETDIEIQAYAEGAPPSLPPVWSALPVLALTQGAAMTPLNVRSFLTAGTTALAAITITATGVPAGMTAADGVLSGTPTTSGAVSITWTATDAFGNAVQYIQTGTIAAGAAPVWASIPRVTITLGQTLPPVRYDTYLGGGVYAVSALTLGVSGQPAGTSLTSRELRGAPTAVGTYTVTVTATNPAGAAAAINHTVNVLAAPTDGGGGTGEGPGGFYENREVF